MKYPLIPNDEQKALLKREFQKLTKIKVHIDSLASRMVESKRFDNVSVVLGDKLSEFCRVSGYEFDTSVTRMIEFASGTVLACRKSKRSYAKSGLQYAPAIIRLANSETGNSFTRSAHLVSLEGLGTDWYRYQSDGKFVNQRVQYAQVYRHNDDLYDIEFM